jgi:NADH-quinone oxidoreductase subunit J
VGPSGLIAAATLFIGLVVVVLDADWLLLGDIEAGSTVEAVLVDTPAQLGRVLLGDFVLAFEVAGVVLLAAVVGALALVRER